MEEIGIGTNNDNKTGDEKGNVTVHAKDSKTQDVLDELASTLGDEWNEEEHEKLMQKLFGEEYYKEDDADEEHIDDGMSERKVNNKKEGIDGKLEGYLDELYSVDRDAQDVPFKYVEVPKEDFGLSIAEILEMDDKELNKRSSFHRLAPYRLDDDPEYAKWRRSVLARKLSKRQGQKPAGRKGVGAKGRKAPSRKGGQISQSRAAAYAGRK